MDTICTTTCTIAAGPDGLEVCLIHGNPWQPIATAPKDRVIDLGILCPEGFFIGFRQTWISCGLLLGWPTELEWGDSPTHWRQATQKLSVAA